MTPNERFEKVLETFDNYIKEHKEECIEFFKEGLQQAQINFINERLNILNSTNTEENNK